MFVSVLASALADEPCEARMAKMLEAAEQRWSARFEAAEQRWSEHFEALSAKERAPRTKLPAERAEASDVNGAEAAEDVRTMRAFVP
eukprot:541337-Prymnesium_polylepis.1